MPTRNAYFGEVPVLCDGLLELISGFALLEKLVGELILHIDPSLDLLALSVFHVSVRVGDPHF